MTRIHGPGRILVVEDDPASLAYARAVLERAGYAVLAAPDAVSALEVVRNHHLDLGLIDLVLPDMSGIDLAKAIRGVDGGDSLPLVAMSAHFSALDAALVSPGGFADCLEKPVEAEVLLRVVQALVPSVEVPIPVGPPRRVLVVDDDPVMLRLLALRVEQLGVEVETATDGKVALSRCRTNPPDAIVSDALMPNLDGFDLCMAVRSDPALTAIPVILVSSHYLEPADEVLGREVGATAYITRSPGADEVNVALRAAFDQQAIGPSRRAAGPVPSLRADHAARIAKQLERQTHLNRVLQERCTFQGGLLSASAAIAESLSVHRDPVTLIEAALSPIMSARGFRAALTFVKADDGSWKQVVSVGRLGGKESESFWGRSDLLDRVAADGKVTIVSSRTMDAGVDHELAERLVAENVLAIPIRRPDGLLRAIVIFVSDFVKIGAEIYAFARSFRAVLSDALTTMESGRQRHQAEKLDAIGRMSIGIAHDVNNVLTAIAVMSHLLLPQFEDGAPGREDLFEILNAVERGARLTGSLLAFSRTSKTESEVLSPDVVISDILAMIRRLLGEEIVVEARLAAGAVSILMDRGQLEQVVVNLSVNARDAMPRGGKLTISTSRVELTRGAPELRPDQPAGSYIVLAVRDLGEGLSPETIALAFEPFFTTKAVGKGTGLGLATVYGIVVKAGGHVSIVSEVGAGTTVSVALPVVEAIATPIPTPLTPTDFTGSETVLVAEDDPSVRRVLVRALSGAGYRVLAASDGEAALTLALECAGEFQMLVTDVSMPGLRGDELARRMRSEEPRLPVLFISGHAGTAASDALDGRGVRFLAKPFQPHEFLKLVRDLLDE